MTRDIDLVVELTPVDVDKIVNLFSEKRRKKMNDTSTKIKQIYNEMLLSKSPSERLRMASGMFDSVKRLAISGLLKERQHLDLPKLRGELFLRICGNDFSATERKRIVEKIPNMQLDTETVKLPVN